MSHYSTLLLYLLAHVASPSAHPACPCCAASLSCLSAAGSKRSGKNGSVCCVKASRYHRHSCAQGLQQMIGTITTETGTEAGTTTVMMRGTLTQQTCMWATYILRWVPVGLVSEPCSWLLVLNTLALSSLPRSPSFVSVSCKCSTTLGHHEVGISRMFVCQSWRPYRCMAVVM